jgi:hypothetical protein
MIASSASPTLPLARRPHLSAPPARLPSAPRLLPRQALLSILAHVIYASATVAPTSHTPRARPADETQALHGLRVVAGLARWVAMPVLILHGLLNYDAARDAGAAWREWSTAGALLGAPPPRVAGLVGALPSTFARLFRADGAPFFDAAASRLLHAYGAVPRHVRVGGVELRGAFVAVVVALFALRALQLALWLAAAPRAPVDGKLRVLICGDSIPPKIDGVAVRVGHLVRALTAGGHTTHIVNSIRRAPLEGAAVTQLEGFEAPCYPGHSITFPNVFSILAAIIRFRPHVIHILDESFMQAATIVAANLCLIPTVWSHHSRLDKFAEACALSEP